MPDENPAERLGAIETKLAGLERLLDEREKRHDQRDQSQDARIESGLRHIAEAGAVAHAALEKRLDALNELRTVVIDQAHSFARSAEVKTMMDAMQARIEGLAGLVHEQVQRGSGMKELWGYIIAGVTVIATIILHFMGAITGGGGGQ